MNARLLAGWNDNGVKALLYGYESPLPPVGDWPLERGHEKQVEAALLWEWHIGTIKGQALHERVWPGLTQLIHHSLSWSVRLEYQVARRTKFTA